MQKTIFVLAALVAMAFAGAAFAGDAHSGATAPTLATTTALTAMSDSDMDKVTAGYNSHATYGQTVASNARINRGYSKFSGLSHPTGNH